MAFRKQIFPVEMRESLLPDVRESTAEGWGTKGATNVKAFVLSIASLFC